MKKHILYIEDMKKCFDLTQNALGSEYSFDWRKTEAEGQKAIREYANQYDAAIVDINLEYDETKPMNEQTTEGLGLIKKLRVKSQELPILCVSSLNQKREALENGATLFMWKKKFWDGEGKQKLEELIK